MVNRMKPALPVGSMKTYGVFAPAETHWRPATCAEVDCPQYLNGWKSVIDESDGNELGQRQASYIRNQSGRRYSEDRDQQPGLTVFTFEPGQTCFNSGRHQVRLDRPELYVVRGGDWRGSTGDARRHANGDDWVDDFANHQQQLADRIRRDSSWQRNQGSGGPR